MFFRAAPLARSLSAQHREAGLRLHELLAKRLASGMCAAFAAVA
jgi:hypothetical protein